MCQIRKFLISHFLCKSYYLIVARMNFQKYSCIFINSIDIIFEVCFVCCPYFLYSSTTKLYYFRNSERSSYFYQLSTGHCNFLILCQCTQSQHYSCRIIVYHKDIFCSCKTFNNIYKMDISAPSLLFCKIKFQIGIIECNIYKIFFYAFTEDTSSKISMKYCSCCIYNSS